MPPLRFLLIGRAHRDALHRTAWIRDKVLGQQLQVARHPVDGGRVEQVAVVLEPAGYPGGTVEDLQFQVEARRAALHIERLKTQSGDVEIRQGDVLEDE